MVTSPGSVSSGTAAGSSKVDDRLRWGTRPCEPARAQSWELSGPAASRWIPMLIDGHMIPHPPRLQSACQPRLAAMLGPRFAPLPKGLSTDTAPWPRSCKGTRSRRARATSCCTVGSSSMSERISSEFSDMNSKR